MHYITRKQLVCWLLFFTFFKSFSQDITVDFEGRVTNDNSILSEVIVQVLQEGKLLTSFKTDNSGTYNVYLPLGHDYLVSISKNNYVQKYFTVSTKGVPSEDASMKFPTITADVDLFKYYEGVDYSLFNEPINKFYYNAKKGNFEYDKAYLKEKKEAMRQVKEQEKEVLLAMKKKKNNSPALAKHTPNKIDTTKKTEGQRLLAQLEKEEQQLFSKPKNNNEVQINLVAASSTNSKKVIDSKISALLQKYKQGVTEEKQKTDQVIIIKRIVVREQEAWVYEKKIFSWGGIAYFRDRQPITASTFNIETSVK